MAQPTMWERVKTGGKSGFDKAWKAADKLGAPVNRLSNKLGSEAFWPTTLDKESDKAARILKTFCKDGFYTEEEVQPEDGPKQKQKVVKKIPTSVIKNAKGLAIFTTMRSGLWISGAGGSGILVARKDDGTWSPPSGILLHTAGLGFLVGIDIYDCVIVINSAEALEAFTKVRCTLGSEISVSAGPVGAGGVLDTEVHKRQAPIFTYLKSRGFYAGVQIDGSVIIERSDENERFYGQKLPVKEILDGKVRHPPYEVRRLLETIKAAQGDTDVDESFLPTEAPPSDFDIEDGHVFGVPDKEDPDPYGVLALEKEGMGIKEAATKKRASWEEFSFNPSPTSPIHNIYAARNSMDSPNSPARRNSWRVSAFGGGERRASSSLRSSMDLAPPPLPARSLPMSTSGTQTDDAPELSDPHKWSSHVRQSSKSSLTSGQFNPMLEVPENKVLETSPEREETEDGKVNGYNTPPRTPPERGPGEEPDRHDPSAQIVEPTAQSVVSVRPASSQVISKARLVTVPKRIPPALPPRHPQRSTPIVVDASPNGGTGTPEETEAEGDSKHDSAHETAVEKDHVELAREKLESVRSDDDGADADDEDEDEDDGGLKSNPFAKAEELRKGQEEHELSSVPGGFPGGGA